MSEVIFPNFNIRQHSVYDIGAEDNGPGVVQEIAVAVEYPLADRPDIDNLGGLIGEVGRNKELQNNISQVRDRLGVTEDAEGIGLARGWVGRSGLLAPVKRGFLSPETEFDDDPACMLIMGGVRNWMYRRASGAISFAAQNRGIRTLLVTGNRPMKMAEGLDVLKGMTESDYAAQVIVPLLEKKGLEVDFVPVGSDVGDEVAAAAAHNVQPYVYSHDSVAVIGNAGNWVQSAGQFRRAMRRIAPAFDEGGNQLKVVSDSFALGETGEEPAATHQNPLTALGIIVRNAQELVRHQN